MFAATLFLNQVTLSDIQGEDFNIWWAGWGE
jgi:hypothetical protein